MRRLFSTFAPGWPGVGLLLMRLVAGISLMIHGFVRLQAGPPVQGIVLGVFAIAIGILLLAGLWTPVAGFLVAALGVWSSIARSGDPWPCIFFATIGAALALVGPGAWSLDARLFGWRQIDFGDRDE